MFSLNMLPVSLVVWYVFLDYHFQGNIPFVTFKGQLISEFPFSCTLVYRIDVQTQINVQVEKFYKKNKRAGHIRRAGGFFSSEKSINVQVGINVQGGILFSKY